MNTVLAVVLTALAFDMSRAQQPEPTPTTYPFLGITNYNDCEGKDAANYTLLQEQTSVCDESFSSTSPSSQLVQCGPNGQRAVNSLVDLALSIYPAGAYQQSERLYFVNGGPLQGKYLYLKTIYLHYAYLKKCSSVLGYSYVTSKSAVMLINDKLDINVLISPTGGYEVFKKGCTTICNGARYIV